MTASTTNTSRSLLCWRINLLLLLCLARLSHSWQSSSILRPLSPVSSKIQRCSFRNVAPLNTFSSSEDYPEFSSSPSKENSMLGDDDDEQDGRLSDEELEATLTEWDPLKPAFNTIHLTGRVGNNPEPKYFDDGKVVVNLSLANKRKYHYMERQQLNLQNGEEETDWYGLEIWGITAEFVSKYVEKGMRVGVIGSLQEDTWIDRESQEPRNRIKVVVRELTILESRAESELRRGGRPSNYNNNNGYSGGGDGPSAAGTGGFFDS